MTVNGKIGFTVHKDDFNNDPLEYTGRGKVIYIYIYIYIYAVPTFISILSYHYIIHDCWNTGNGYYTMRVTPEGNNKATEIAVIGNS
jgi:hypothetical protein